MNRLISTLLMVPLSVHAAFGCCIHHAHSWSDSCCIEKVAASHTNLCCQSDSIDPVDQCCQHESSADVQPTPHENEGQCLHCMFPPRGTRPVLDCSLAQMWSCLASLTVVPEFPSRIIATLAVPSTSSSLPRPHLLLSILLI